MNAYCVLFRITLGLGFLWLLIAVVVLVQSLRAWGRAVKTRGTVTGYHRAQREIQHHDGSTPFMAWLHFPILTFTDDQGRSHEVTSDVGYCKPEFCGPVGASVPVVYPPDQPAQARVATCLQTLFNPLCLLAIGVFWVLFSLVCLWHLSSFPS
jgi:hypothetical protein